MTYPVILERDADGNVIVAFPDFPEAHTFGDDVDEALVRAREALVTIIDAYIRDRQPIPEPSRTRAGWHDVRLPVLTAMKVALYNSMRDANVSKTVLARRLGWHLPQVDRLLDVHHASHLDQLEAAFTALGKELVVAAMDRQARPTHQVRAPARGGVRAGAATGLGVMWSRDRSRSRVRGRKLGTRQHSPTPKQRRKKT